MFDHMTVCSASVSSVSYLPRCGQTCPHASGQTTSGQLMIGHVISGGCGDVVCVCVWMEDVSQRMCKVLLLAGGGEQGPAEVRVRLWPDGEGEESPLRF